MAEGKSKENLPGIMVAVPRDLMILKGIDPVIVSSYWEGREI